MKRIAMIIVAVALLLAAVFALQSIAPDNTYMQQASGGVNNNDGVIQYIPIGDSYTIGLGVEESERWPNVMVKNLSNNIPMEIVESPAVSGYTFLDAMRVELPLVEKVKPEFVTVLLGANDAFSGISFAEFRNRTSEFLDRLVQTVPANKIVVVTLPDYGSAPGVKDPSETLRIQEYNAILRDEATTRGIAVADIFPASQQIATDETMFIDDGLHPSAKQYQLWEEQIRPVVLNLLKK